MCCQSFHPPSFSSYTFHLCFFPNGLHSSHGASLLYIYLSRLSITFPFFVIYYPSLHQKAQVGHSVSLTQWGLAQSQKAHTIHGVSLYPGPCIRRLTLYTVLPPAMVSLPAWISHLKQEEEPLNLNPLTGEKEMNTFLLVTYFPLYFPL